MTAFIPSGKFKLTGQNRLHSFLASTKSFHLKPDGKHMEENKLTSSNISFKIGKAHSSFPIKCGIKE